MNRLLIPSAALLWGLQFAFLNPALALILVALYGATPGQVGAVLAVYSASGFLASLVIPGWADRRHDYLRPMLGCGVLTLLLAGVLAIATALPAALVALIVLGGPAGVGSSLLFAHLRHSGAAASAIVNTRAMVSVAWVAGPPVATVIIGTLGNAAILLAVAAVALINIATTAIMLAQHRRRAEASTISARPAETATMRRTTLGVLIGAFVLLQATNTVTVSVMSLYVTESLQISVIWAGIALGMSAGLEIPALLVIGRLADRHSNLMLIITGCVAAVACYTLLAAATGPVMLLLAQVFNAWFFATVAGVGLTFFQAVIPRPGLASGIFANTRRIGAIVSGGVIAVGSSTALGYRGTFLSCVALTVAALILVVVVHRTNRRPSTTHEVELST